MSKPPKQHKPEDDNDKPVVDPQRLRSYARYSGMAIQMGITILLGTLLGQWLDEQLQTGPYLTVLLALFSIFAALYIALKDLFVPNKSSDDADENKPT